MRSLERSRRYSRAPSRGSSQGDDHHRERVVNDGGVVLLLAILLVLFVSFPSPWNVIVLAVACVLEVVEIAFLRRWSKRLDRRTARTTGSEAMIGRSAEVVEPCRPKGTVQLQGELWEARCEGGADAGETVRVKSIDGLTLIVAH
jgi:membrane-bound serine protease (ClpP class)